jgi:2-methylaconitate cis-trans-isomerase PrpF
VSAIPAVFMRGGTSRGLIFHARDLPADRAAWDPLFLAAMGSPDAYGRQLNGMGGGVSSLSKVCVVAASTRTDADIDYTFAQVLIREPRVDYKGNCGNMLAAVAVFAMDEGLVAADGDRALVRIYNTNTRKLIHARLPMRAGRVREDGDLVIPGVAGSGAPIRMDFIEPGGATTGQLLPTGKVADVLDVPGIGALRVSMVDAGNACVFVRAADVGLSGTELPEALEQDSALMARLQALRVEASLAMGIAASREEARLIVVVPYVGIVSAAADAASLSGQALRAAEMDLAARVIASGQPHRALPLTVSLCIAVAARIEGSVVHEVCAPNAGETLRIGMPSGVLTVGAEVQRDDAGWSARSGSFYRTARRLFDGKVYA